MSEFYARQRGGLIRYASIVSRDESGAEDLVQEAWLRCRGIAGKEAIADPDHLFRRVLRNLAVDRQRSLTRERARTAEPDGAVADIMADDAPCVERVVSARRELDMLRAALGELDDRTRVAFEMHRFEGARLADIAAALGISVTRAHELVASALRHCRDALRRDD